MTVTKGTLYSDQGAQARNFPNQDVSDQVKITVNGKEGDPNSPAVVITMNPDVTYTIKYVIEDENGKAEATRTVNVIGAEDGIVAWNLLLKHSDDIDLVVTDIEMPNLNGYELSEKIREDGRFSGMPIIALTTMAGEEDIARGEAVGIDDYQIKLDREKLMRSVYHYLKEKPRVSVH